MASYTFISIDKVKEGKLNLGFIALILEDSEDIHLEL